MTALEPVAYTHADRDLTGWLAHPSGTPRAAVIVFPTIVNVNAPVERRARMLAEQGYLAMIADFYGEPVETFEASLPLAEALRADVSHYRARLASAMAALRSVPGAEKLPMLAIGYCMGGQAALEAARDGQDLLAAVSFHGILSTDGPAQSDVIKSRLLVCHGDADPLVPRKQVMAFWEEMDRAGADWHFHSYSKVRHGFTDPGSDARGVDAVKYDASADRQSWTAMLSLFDEVLG
ncbi:dienelactone hydrolase family protein [Novosphingobium mangrovi (ex Huang et al. 2023)]|uniref:Dienelactone hydrolase family protein n=1 Tax=Novosphingobium mangrovi (ex Huang et al. 2023) TaxID=2976432 RepID=A0ABT2I855_9SPHN|nr:dienelactone hydrolase family protein [Novosphingobium mangrovi (ex Huang et al. 2023)]MCT2400768.1 dienelactone hydrolase family protein [Novosphingobium mangrovi (ex Huang et al. 2023)]